MSHGKRTKKIQMYLNPEGETDRLVLDLWTAVGARRAELFRRIMRAGIRALLESGEISPELARKAKLHKHLPAVHVQPSMHQPMQMPYPYPLPPQGYGLPYPTMPPGPAAPFAQPEPDEEAQRPVESRPQLRAVETASVEPIRPVEQRPAPAPVAEEELPPAAPRGKHAILGLMGNT